MNGLSPAVLAKSLTEVGLTVLVLVAAIAALEAVLYLVFQRWLKHKLASVIMLLAPAALGLAALVVFPLLYEFRLAFSNMNLYRFKNPEFGFDLAIANFKRIFTQPVLKQVTFVPLLLRTFLWTFIQISFHVLGGLCLAMLLNRKIRFRGVYRALLVFPWAIPQIIAVLAWRGEFHYEYGYINIMLQKLGMVAVNWKQDPFWNFVAINMVNIWLGIPFMMITLLGGLQSIDPTYYEAASIDGAGGFTRFRTITLPLLKPILTPSIVYGIIWTFNNFNVPYFINEQELESSDILVTALFRAAFEYNQYGFSAAFALVIFVILLGLTVLYMRISNFKPMVRRARVMVADTSQ